MAIRFQISREGKRPAARLTERANAAAGRVDPCPTPPTQHQHSLQPSRRRVAMMDQGSSGPVTNQTAERPGPHNARCRSVVFGPTNTGRGLPVVLTSRVGPTAPGELRSRVTSNPHDGSRRPKGTTDRTGGRGPRAPASSGERRLQDDARVGAATWPLLCPDQALRRDSFQSRTTKCQSVHLIQINSWRRLRRDLVLGPASRWM